MENLGWGGVGRFWFTLFYACFFFFLRPAVLDPAVSVANGSWLWFEINTMDKAIKALFVPFVATG